MFGPNPIFDTAENSNNERVITPHRNSKRAQPKQSPTNGVNRANIMSFNSLPYGDKLHQTGEKLLNQNSGHKKNSGKLSKASGSKARKEERDLGRRGPMANLVKKSAKKVLAARL